jgi:asparagine synthase (glutamine-hydrolysing)
MCGICGFIGVDAGILKSMCNSMLHRGPDSEGVWSSESIHLGMRRLAIVDLESTQPVFNEDKSIVVVMNGEIYNYPELRIDLDKRGHKFRFDHSDTEIVPHLYEEYGVEWVSHVNGMFAVALYDNNEKKLFLFRDRIGKKPL